MGLHTNWDDRKQLIPGYFKDEFGGRFLLEFIGLRAKMYSIQPLEGDKKATAKGINGNVKNEVLTHQNYKDSLFQELQMKHKMTTIQGENHELFTVELDKTKCFNVTVQFSLRAWTISKTRTKNQEPKPRTKNQEPRTKNKNQEQKPRTKTKNKNQEQKPRTKNKNQTKNQNQKPEPKTQELELKTRTNTHHQPPSAISNIK